MPKQVGAGGQKQQTKRTNAQIVYAFLIKKGLTPVAAAGVVGTLMAESGVQTNNPNSSSGANGIAQWLGGRADSLVAFAKKKGKPWDNLGVQMDFLWHELSGAYSHVLNQIQGAGSPSDAAYIFTSQFEIPQKSAWHEGDQNAQAVFHAARTGDWSSTGAAGGGGGGGGGSTGFTLPGGIPTLTGGRKTTYAYYASVLQNLGIPTSDVALAFSRHAASKQWTTGEFMFHLRETDFYRQSFPGILRHDGTFRYSEGSYMALENAYRQVLPGLDRDQIGYLITHQVSPREFADRAEAIKRLNEFAPAFNAFGEVLNANGMAPKGGLKRKDLFDFVMGKAPLQWEKLWEQTATETAAHKAGFDLTIGQIRQLVGSMPGIQSEQQLDPRFAQLTKEVSQLSSEAGPELAAAGLGKSDLLLLEFPELNRRRADKVASAVEQIVRNRQAVSQVPDQSGVQYTDTGRPISPTAPQVVAESV